jgi:hypothetical protein
MKMWQPAVALAITVFITMWFGYIRSYPTFAEQAFMNNVVIRMSSVPLTSKLTFWFVNCRVVDAL